MITAEDRALLESKGISEAQMEQQLEQFKTGFPYLTLVGPAAVGNGIQAIGEAEQRELVAKWEAYKQEGHRVTKFVPASGAASRMFKDMFAFLEASYD